MIDLDISALRNATLSFLKAHYSDPRLPILVRLLAQFLDPHLQVVEDRMINPRLHHWQTLYNALQILARLPNGAVLVAPVSACALGHDSSPEPKVPSSESRDAERYRVARRLIHMAEGAAITVAAAEHADAMIEDVFDVNDLVTIACAVGGHDAPSIGCPVSDPSDVLRVLWAADALWMVQGADSTQPLGLRADLWRREEDFTDAPRLRWQLGKNLKSLARRRTSVAPAETFAGPTFFGMEEAFPLFEQALRAWAGEFGVSPQELLREAGF